MVAVMLRVCIPVTRQLADTNEYELRSPCTAKSFIMSRRLQFLSRAIFSEPVAAAVELYCCSGPFITAVVRYMMNEDSTSE